MIGVTVKPRHSEIDNTAFDIVINRISLRLGVLRRQAPINYLGPTRNLAGIEIDYEEYPQNLSLSGTTP